MNISVVDLKNILNLNRTVIERADLTYETAKFVGYEYQKQVYNLSVRPDARYLHRCPKCMETDIILQKEKTFDVYSFFITC